jgi:phage tail sheath protein FI
VQVAYPWFKQVAPPRTAEGLVAPDGALAGLIAATALSAGAFRTAAGRSPVGVYDVEPLPPARELQTPSPEADAAAWTARLSLFAPRIDRIELLADRTLSNRSGWRNAPVGRLMGQLLRLARRTGEAFSFEAAGDALFARIRGRFEDLLTVLWQRGALRGTRPAEAFSVRCDRALMSQADLDNGRVVCAIEFAPAFSIERLRVELWLGESGTVAWRETDEIPETVS